MSTCFGLSCAITNCIILHTRKSQLTPASSAVDSSVRAMYPTGFLETLLDVPALRATLEQTAVVCLPYSQHCSTISDNVFSDYDNYCLENPTACDVDQICTPTGPGAAECTCKEGYSVDAEGHCVPSTFRSFID